MSENTRKINIDLEMLKIPSRNKTSRKREPTNEKKIKVRTPAKANNKSLKRNLLKFIRNQQDNKMQSTEPLDLEFKSDFKESLEYLSDIAKKNDIPKISHNKTLKNFDILPSPTIDLPIFNNVEPIIKPTGAPFRLPQPTYGCLKGGKLPLYTRRQYNNVPNTATVFKPILPPSIGSPAPPPLPLPPLQPPSSLQLPPSLMPSSNVNLDKINMIKAMNSTLSISDVYQPKQPCRRRKTLRRTYKIGKSKNTPKVSVLISNKTIRNQISNKSQMLKQTPIYDIKKHLIKNGFIKVGSIAPNDVLRKMYETSMLMCGEIHNYNPDNLLYNYFNSES
jgi:hypothetical protein